MRTGAFLNMFGELITWTIEADILLMWDHSIARRFCLDHVWKPSTWDKAGLEHVMNNECYCNEAEAR